jgi:exosortase
MPNYVQEKTATQQTILSLLVPAAVIIVFALLTWPVWRWLWGEWMANDYYSHGVLIAPVALYLAWRRLRNGKPGQWRADLDDNRGLVLLAASLGLYLAFLNNKAYYLAAFALIGLLAGVVWILGAAHTVRKLAFPLGYLALMVPLPFVDRATLPLALFTGVCSTVLVKFLGVNVTILGNAITLPNADLIIGAQCSGINSIMALTALNALAAYIVAGPWWGRVTLVLLAVPVAMLGNILRIASLLFVARAYGAQAAFSYYHSYSGVVFFVLALAMLIPLMRLLRCRTLRLDVL